MLVAIGFLGAVAGVFSLMALVYYSEDKPCVALQFLVATGGIIWFAYFLSTLPLPQ